MDIADGFSDRFKRATSLAGFPDERGWQQRIADELGVRNQAVGQWLRGETYPSSETMLKIAQRFGVSLDWLLLGRGRIYPGDGVSEREMAYIVKLRCLSPSQQDSLTSLLEEIPPKATDCSQAA